MSNSSIGKKIVKIGSPVLNNYDNRMRSGRTQVFYTGNDSRDFERYRAEDGGRNHAVEMHDKPDTIRVDPPEKHYYAEKIEGEWWWVNGCAECNGEPRDWMTYVECEKHDVCRTCSTPRSELKENPWGGKHGWQCKPCADKESAALKADRLSEFEAAGYDEHDFMGRDEVVCPHCASSYMPNDFHGLNEKTEVCDVCDGEFSIEIKYSVLFSTKRLEVVE